MNPIIRRAKDEQGFLSAIVILMFFMILTVLGLSAFQQTQSEGVLVADQFESKQTRFAANGSADFALRNFEAGLFENGTLPVSPGGVSLAAYITTPSSSEQTTYSANRLLTVSDASDTYLKVYFYMCSAGYSDKCIYITGSSDITASGTTAPCATITKVQNIPPINETSLKARAQSQSHVYTASTWTVPSSPSPWPSGNFYQTGTTPWATWVNGNMTLGNSKTAYGIFAVSGNVTMGTSSKIEGVVYLMSHTSTLTMGSSSSITGGVVGYGTIDGTTITQNTTRMTAFNAYATSSSVVAVVNKTPIFNP